MASVFFYISSHGFGHASRQIEVVNALGRLRPDIRICIRTSAARWLFDRTVRPPFTWLEGECDTGVVQIDSLRLDEAETIRRAARFHDDLPRRAVEEAGILRRHDAGIVVGDAPPLACAAATQSGIGSIVLSNFTWDWIYQGYADRLAMAPDLIPTIQEAYRRASAGWRLPLHGGFATIENITDLPFVARHATRERNEVRRVLGLPADRLLALSSFGGYGVRDFDPHRLDCLHTHTVVMTGQQSRPDLPAGMHYVEERRIYDAGFRYEDLVRAVDVVVTKPGYGIIAECVANGTAMLYTSRGRFAEYDGMVAQMPRYLRCGFIDQEALLAGRWCDALDRVLALPPPPERPRTDGADIAARMLSEQLC